MSERLLTIIFASSASFWAKIVSWGQRQGPQDHRGQGEGKGEPWRVSDLEGPLVPGKRPGEIEEYGAPHHSLLKLTWQRQAICKREGWFDCLIPHSKRYKEGGASNWNGNEGTVQREGMTPPRRNHNKAVVPGEKAEGEDDFGRGVGSQRGVGRVKSLPVGEPDEGRGEQRGAVEKGSNAESRGGGGTEGRNQRGGDFGCLGAGDGKGGPQGLVRAKLECGERGRGKDLHTRD